MSPLSWWDALDERTVIIIKVILAAVGAGIFGWMAFAALRLGRPRPPRWADRLLIAVAALSYLAHYNFGHFYYSNDQVQPGGGYIQTWDYYHYYIGSKYFRELGFTRLYDCTIIADVDDRVPHPDGPLIRDPPDQPAYVGERDRVAPIRVHRCVHARAVGVVSSRRGLLPQPADPAGMADDVQ